MDARDVRPRQARGRDAGFTLVELLVVIAVITILAGITVPATFSVWQHGRETSCRNNLRQVGDGLLMYATSWDRYFPANRRYKGPTRPRGWDDLSPLYGVDAEVKRREGTQTVKVTVRTTCFVPDLRSFNCPSTRDHATTPLEIRFKRTEQVPDGAPVEVPRKQQLSYEYCGEFNPALQYARINPQIAWLAHDEDAIAESLSGPSLIEQYLGTADNTNRIAGTMSQTPVEPRTVVLVISSSVLGQGFQFNDDGLGHWASSGGEPVIQGTVDYTTGAFEAMTFFANGTPWTWFYDPNLGGFDYFIRYRKQGTEVAVGLSKNSNHRLRGGNMLFVDGRVEWVPPLRWSERVMSGMAEWARVTGWTPD